MVDNALILPPKCIDMHVEVLRHSYNIIICLEINCHAFSFMGSGPIGAIFSGYLVQWFGPVVALTIASMLMLLVVAIVGLTSQLWNLGK